MVLISLTIIVRLKLKKQPKILQYELQNIKQDTAINTCSKNIFFILKLLHLSIDIRYTYLYYNKM